MLFATPVVLTGSHWDSPNDDPHVQEGNVRAELNGKRPTCCPLFSSVDKVRGCQFSSMLINLALYWMWSWWLMAYYPGEAAPLSDFRRFLVEPVISGWYSHANKLFKVVSCEIICLLNGFTLSHYMNDSDLWFQHNEEISLHLLCMPMTFTFLMSSLLIRYHDGCKLFPLNERKVHIQLKYQNTYNKSSWSKSFTVYPQTNHYSDQTLPVFM